MVKTIEPAYKCEICRSRYATMAEAETCEINCGAVRRCTFCTKVSKIVSVTRDAADVEHHLCDKCLKDITTLGEVVDHDLIGAGEGHG